MYPTVGTVFDDQGIFDREWISGRHKMLTCTDTWKAEGDCPKCPAFTLSYSSTGYK
jgi:hypothetical protein